VKLCRRKNDKRFEKIEDCRDRCAASVEKFIGNKPGDQRTGGGYERD